MSSLAPYPKFRAFTAGNALLPVRPLVGGKLYTYAAGTTTPKVTYTDETESTENTNPVILNARGEADVWLGLGAYKFVLTDALGIQQGGPVDNIKSLDQYLFEANAYTDAAVSDAATGVASVSPFVTITGNGTTDNSAAVAAAVALAIASHKSLAFVGISVIGTPTVITVPISNGRQQIFSTGSQVTIDNGGPLLPEWWGGGEDTLWLAHQALPVPTGGVIDHGAGRYLTSNLYYGFGADQGRYISKSNVTIRGAGAPQFAEDCKQLIGGTVIEGTLIGFADNLRLEGFGEDNGFTVGQANFAGEAPIGQSDAVAITYPNDALKEAASRRRGLTIRDVVSLCYGPSTLAHALLVEGYTDVDVTGSITTCFGVHGFVVKSENVRAGSASIAAYCHHDDNLIIKSASGPTAPTARSNNVQIGPTVLSNVGPPGCTPYAVPAANVGVACKLHAEGSGIDSVTFGPMRIIGQNIGVQPAFDGAYPISRITFDTISTDTNAQIGLSLSTSSGGSLPRWQIGKITYANTPIGANFDWVNAPGDEPVQMQIEALQAIGTTYASITAANNPYVSIGNHMLENCAAVYRLLGAPRLQVGGLQRGDTPILYSTTDGGTQPTLGTGWGQGGAGSSPFGVDLVGSEAELRGLLTPGGASICVILPPFCRPTSTKFGVGWGLNGATATPVRVQIGTDGNVTALGLATAYATSLSLDGIRWGLVL